MITQPTDLVQVLTERASFPQGKITFIESGDREETLSYTALYHASGKVLSRLITEGMRPGDELLLQVEHNRSFLIVFWACLLGGIIPVPLSIGRNDEHTLKLFNVWAVLKRPYLIISGPDREKLGAFAASHGLHTLYGGMEGRVIDLDEALDCRTTAEVFSAGPDAVAFIQFSSGSTGRPKGVVLTHKNLLTNIWAISRAARYSGEDSLLSWMPLTHDMGLIGFHLNPLCCGLDHYLMPPSLFVRRPALWLDKATKHRTTVLCSPNFGYEYLQKHCLLSADSHDWDLSSVRLIYNGAEPVSEHIYRQFIHRLAPFGLKKNAMCPVYGLAEASLAVTISGLAEEPIALNIDRTRSGLGDKVTLVPSGEAALSFVNVGTPVDGCMIRIADREDTPVEENIIGHLLIKGDNVTSGYYNNDEETGKSFTEEGWFRTGDLAFTREGALYITGRTKDIIFVNGQNYYPHDLEQVAAGVDGIELNKIVIAGCSNTATQKEEAIAFVLHRGDEASFMAIARSLRSVINLRTGLWLDRVIPVADIPRTTSGKLQRFKLVQQFRDGRFGEHMRTSGTGDPSFVLPEGDTTEVLLRIWRHVLEEEDIDLYRSFFEMGGTSLRAAVIMMLVQKAFGLVLPVETLYEKPTLQQLAFEIDLQQATSPGDAAYMPLPSSPETEDHPLSPAQISLYYAWEADKLSLSYNLPAAFSITGEISPGRLEDCLRQLIARHEAWRMVFSYKDQPRLRILDSVPLDITVEDCSPEDVNKCLRRMVRPFDLYNGPLFRFGLLRTGVSSYFLLADLHHIISDGISMYHFIRELQGLYDGRGLSPLPARYRDYIYWRGLQNSSPLMKRQETFWLERLQRDLPVLDLPADFPRPSVFVRQGGKIPVSIDVPTSQQLRALAAEISCPLHRLMFSAYAVLLFKYTGQTEMVIGMPVGGRTHPDLYDMQGMFVNNLPVFCQIDPDDTFIQLVKQQHVAISEALLNQDYSFEDMVRTVSPQRDVSRNPLFDTMFVYQDMGSSPAKNGGLALSRHFFDPGFSKFDISLEVFDDGRSMHCAVEYSAGIFSESTARTLADHFEGLVRKIIRDAASRISELSLLSAAAYDDCILRFNDTGSVYQADRSVHQWFEQVAAKMPDAIAIRHGSRQMTYHELNERSEEFACRLREKGVGADRIAAILLPRGPELIISLLAVLKADGCYLPIDTDVPDERVRFMLQDSRCGWLITSHVRMGERWLSDMPGGAIIGIDGSYLPSTEKGLITDDMAPMDGSDLPHNLAYIIYTSGTTGVPKGVMIEHASLTNYISWAVEAYSDGNKLSFPLFTSISFDLTVTPLFVPLVTGGAILIYDEETTDQDLVRIFTADEANIIKLTPSHLRLLQAIGHSLPAGRHRIKRFIVGGERLGRRLAIGILDQFGEDTILFNEYGPTEATVGCMIHRFTREDLAADVPIGVPAANTRIYLLDKFLQPVAAGVKGEIFIAGHGLARGYLHREGLTSQKFIADVFNKGERMYKTGDLGRRLPGGIIAYSGRSDRQVKLNGYRVELEEIERFLTGYADISEAFVTLRRNADDRDILCAYYVSPADASSGNGLTETSWREELSQKLPHYMIPAHFIRLKSFPLTRNGKIDMAALPEPVLFRGSRSSSQLINAVEQSFLDVWGEVLGEKDLDIMDNFFELGGDSIKAVQISSRLREKGFNMEVKDILTFPTIAQASLHAGFYGPGGRYPQTMAEGRMSLTPIAAWFFSLNLSAPGFYNQSVLLKLSRKVRKELLEETFRVLLEHHDGLRINFDSSHRQLFYNSEHNHREFMLEERIMSASVFRVLKEGFDVEKDLLFRAALLGDPYHTDDPGWLFMTAHHLVIDAVSWRIFLEDLYSVCTALENSLPLHLPQKTAALTAWEQELEAYALSEQSGQQQSYWELADKTPFVLPADAHTDDWSAGNRRKVTGSLDSDRTDFLLRAAHKTYNTDIPVILNTALGFTLHEWTGLNLFIVEQEHHGRSLGQTDVSRTLGWFTVLYPLRLTWRADSIAQRLQAVKEEMRAIPDHGMGYGVSRYLRPAKANGGHAPAEIRLNYLGQFGAELSNELFAFCPMDTGSDMASQNNMTVKLECNAMVMGNQLHLEINYNSLSHHTSSIEWFRDAFFRHLDNILRHIEGEKDVHFTPSDFDAACLKEEDLKELFN
jgi:amino acid adenylation domain-containing protein/non-ribosomal peptide synthase protein (TIGR01720 family)